MNKQHDLQWFLDRIGKRIYRRPLCPCKECQQTYVDILDGIKDGMQKFRREFHARYLYDCQNDMQIEYSDNPIVER